MKGKSVDLNCLFPTISIEGIVCAEITEDFGSVPRALDCCRISPGSMKESLGGGKGTWGNQGSAWESLGQGGEQTCGTELRGGRKES